MLEQTKPATDEYAVMIDARDALDVDRRRPRPSNGPATSTAGKADCTSGGRLTDEARDAARRHARRPARRRRVAISRARSRCPRSPRLLQEALDDWSRCAPLLRTLSQHARSRARRRRRPFRSSARRWRRCRAPITGSTARPTSITSSWCARRAAPRCRRASGPIRWSTRAAPTICSVPRDDVPVAERGVRHRSRGEVAVITDDVPMGTTPREARAAHQAADAGQRLVAAQPDSRRSSRRASASTSRSRRPRSRRSR